MGNSWNWILYACINFYLSMVVGFTTTCAISVYHH